MSQNGMSTGRDYTLSYYDPDTGQVVELGDVQNVKITARKHDIKSQPYNDVPRYGYIGDGYAITFEIVRTGPELENFQLGQNTRFNQGQSSRAGFLNETITETDGSVSRYQYTKFVFWVTDIGTITREAPVKMSAEGMASDKVQLA